MATFTDPGFPNLANVLQRMKPDGSIVPMAEVLNKKLDFIDDIPWAECNLELGHQVSYRTGLPNPQWRKLNQGVDKTKTDGASFIETTGMLEDRAEVDKDMPGNIAQLRLQEEAGKVEMMTQEFSRACFYESVADNADRIHGITPRYGGTSGYTASSYVLKGTNAGTNCRSIWLIAWGLGKIYGIYPKRSQAGLLREDLGVGDCYDSNNKPFRGYRSRLQWKCGIAVEDYRYSCRFQWDPDDANFADTAKGMYLAMQQMLGTVFALDGNARFYMDRTTYNKLLAQLANNTTNFLEFVAMGGRRIPVFLGTPIRVTDALVAETAIA